MIINSWLIIKLVICATVVFTTLNTQANSNSVECKNWIYLSALSKKSSHLIPDKNSFTDSSVKKLTFGFTPHRHWIKVECINNSANPFSGIVQFQYPIVETLNIYNNLEQLPSFQLGIDAKRLNKVIESHILPEFKLNIVQAGMTRFYIEAQSLGSLQLQYKIIKSDSDLYLLRPSFLYGIFFGTLLALMMYNLFLGASLRDTTYLYYCGYVLFFFLYQISVTGYSPLLFGKLSYTLIDFRAIYLHLLFTFIALFANSFLFLKEKAKRLSKLVVFIAALHGIIAILSLVLPIQKMLLLSAISSLLVPITLLTIAFVAYKRGYTPAKFFIIAWLFFLGAIIITAMRNFGLFPKIWITDHVLEFGIVGEVFLISLGLAFKVRLLEAERNIAVSQASADKLLVARLDAQLEKEKYLSNLASQVSHDIRSPLSALNMVSSHLGSIPESRRILMRMALTRINDIANNLLNRSESGKPKDQTDSHEVVLLTSLVDSLVSEKRIQFGNCQDLRLELILDRGYGIFVKLSSAEFKSMLSNLLNNSFEALPASKGYIRIEAYSFQNSVVIDIEDDGRGIPARELSQLGQKGVSFGKENTNSGSGLGVYHANRLVKSLGGSIEISSKVNHGTTVKIRLPKCTAPQWFLAELLLTRGQSIVAVDDDLSILEIWKQRLSHSMESIGCKLILFKTGAALESWIASNPTKAREALFLIDYEFVNQAKTGLEMIKELGITHNSILVTSRYHEIIVKQSCIELGVRLLPKSMASIIDIKIKNGGHLPSHNQDSTDFMETVKNAF